MTKKGKIITGVVTGAVVLGGIGAVMNKDEVPSSDLSATTNAIIETNSVETSSSSSVQTTIEEIITSISEKETEAEKTEPPATSAAVVATTKPALNTTQAPTPIVTTTNKFSTINYVLNTSTLKIHRPGCRDIKKIAPENYSTTTDFDKAISIGYTTCGHCF